MKASRASLFILVALLPTASAATPFVGDVELSPPPRLEGALEASTAEGFLDLSAASDAWRLEWAAARGYVVTREREEIALPDGSFLQRGASSENRTLRYGAGALSSVHCEGACLVSVVTTGVGTLRAQGEGAWAPRRLASPEIVYAGVASPSASDAFYFEAPAGWLELGEGAGPTASASGEGALLLVLWNATATLRHGEGVERIRTGNEATPLRGPASVVIGRRIEETFLVLRVEEARLASDPGAPFRLVGASFDGRFGGAWSSPHAEGWLRLGATNRTLAGESIRLEGELDVRLGSEATGLGMGGAPFQAPGMRARFDGSVTSLAVAGASWVASPGAPPDPLLGSSLGLLFATAAFLLFRFSTVPLYMRIEASTVLDNPNRIRLLDAIREAPGSNVSQLSRRLALARVVVQHHLRMLEAHRQVVVRQEGRRTGYFLPQHACASDQARALVLLQDGTRRAVVESLASCDAPLSQRDLAARTGLPQRVLSYHLVLLERQRLVEASGSMPRRYRLADAALAPIPDAREPAPRAVGGKA